MRIDAGDRMTRGRFVALLAFGSSRREHAVVNRAGFSNEADSLAPRLLNRSEKLIHLQSVKLCPPFHLATRLVDTDFEATQAVTKE
jgi:hypothetical protein